MGIVKTKGLLTTKVYFPELDELVEKLIAKCVACRVVRKNTNIQLQLLHQHIKAKDTVGIVTSFITFLFFNSSFLISL